jgi:phosphoglycolate phosphatase
MRRTGHAPANSWMVGDHHTDLEAARRAGLRSIFLQSGFGHPGAENPDLAFPDFATFVSTFLSRP